MGIFTNERFNNLNDLFLHELKDEVNEMLKVLEQHGALVLKTPEARQGKKQQVAV